jgi:hypothetical protein
LVFSFSEAMMSLRSSEIVLRRLMQIKLEYYRSQSKVWIRQMPLVSPHHGLSGRMQNSVHEERTFGNAHPIERQMSDIPYIERT